MVLNGNLVFYLTHNFLLFKQTVQDPDQDLHYLQVSQN